MRRERETCPPVRQSQHHRLFCSSFTHTHTCTYTTSHNYFHTLTSRWSHSHSLIYSLSMAEKFTSSLPDLRLSHWMQAKPASVLPSLIVSSYVCLPHFICIKSAYRKCVWRVSGHEILSSRTGFLSRHAYGRRSQCVRHCNTIPRTTGPSSDLVPQPTPLPLTHPARLGACMQGARRRHGRTGPAGRRAPRRVGRARSSARATVSETVGRAQGTPQSRGSALQVRRWVV